ncbi:MAG: carboxypeptidase-like regulatory domain-containing protein [Hydrogenophaga sp.]|nr:carboxypeptidase-like regulatory domain-containing protein [Hydrogenophaga sp.]
MQRMTKIFLTSLALAGLVACGGGSDPVELVPVVASLSGTAAVGAPLANAKLVLKDANGITKETTADANGKYKFADLAGLTAPLMLQAKGTVAGMPYALHSLLTELPAAAGVINVTPATEAVTAQVLGKKPEDSFAIPAEIKAVKADVLTAAKTRLNQALSEVFAALGQSSSVDLFTTAFEANSTGLDKLLDLVAFSAEAADSSQQILVRNRTTNQQIVVTTASSVTPLPKPSEALVSLDIASIKALVDSFNTLVMTEAGRKSDAMKDLVDPDFLEEGANRTVLVADFNDAQKFASYLIHDCVADTKVCKVQLSQGAYSFETQVKQGADKKWRFYGNRSAFEFDLKAGVSADYTVSGGSISTSTVQTGVKLWIPVNQGYKSAKLFVSNDNGATWNDAIDLKVNSACSNEHMVIDNGSSNCNGSFQPLTDAQANAANEVIKKGTRKFKVAVYSDDMWKTKVHEFVGQSRGMLYTQATGNAALTNSGLGITPAQLGTGSVSFTGKSIESVSAQFYTSPGMTGHTWWEGMANIAALNGKVTVAAANAVCKTNSAESVCNNAYGSGAVVESLVLTAYDAGNQIQASYVLSGGGDAAPTVGQ